MRHKGNIVKGEMLANSVFSIWWLTLLMQTDGEEANSLYLPISANLSLQGALLLIGHSHSSEWLCHIF